MPQKKLRRSASKKSQERTTSRAPVTTANAPTTMDVRREPSFLQLLGVQIGIGLSAMGVLMLMGVIQGSPLRTYTTAAQSTTAHMTVEHGAPLQLKMVVTQKGPSSTIRLENATNEEISVSLPSVWTRTEVAHAPLDAFQRDMSISTTSRWTIPARGIIVFHVAESPSILTIDNAATTTTLLSIIRIDLERDTVSSASLLVQDHGEISLLR